MPRDVLLLEEMIEAADRAVALVEGLTVEDLTADWMRRDALLWNFAVLGEAVTQLSQELKDRFPEIPWRQPARLRNRIIHGTGRSISMWCTRRPASNCRDSWWSSAVCAA
jgi:uncharacterized protein with HEPN domain